MRVVLDLERFHNVGSHCLTTAIRTLFAQKGIDFQEEIILGLGSGLGFTYVRQPDGFIFGGRGGNLEANLSDSVGIRTIFRKSDNTDISWQEKRDLILQGIPLICEADMSKLPYMVERLKTRGSGFSGHKFILIGFDDEQETVYVLDYLWKNVIEVKHSDFMAAINSSIKPMAPDNLSVQFDIPSRLYNFKGAVYKAIDYNVNQMKYPVGFGLGLEAEKRFFKEITCWPEILDEEALRYELNMAQLTFEKVGTGGGNFRRMYSRFLKTSAEILDSEALMKASVVYAYLGKLWKQYAKELYKASLAEDVASESVFSKKNEVALEILHEEEHGIACLETYLEEMRNA